MTAVLVAIGTAAAGCGGDEQPAETSQINRPLVVSSGEEPNAAGEEAGHEPAPLPAGPGEPGEVGVGAPGGACSGGGLAPGGDNVADVRAATVCLLNAERRSRGLQTLRPNSTLRSAALEHSRDMVARRYFSHVSPSGDGFADRVRRAGYGSGAGAWTAGENLAWGTGTRAQAREIVQAWMDSPGHRANILNPRFREIGLGIVLGVPDGQGTGATYTTAFGARSGR
jgi:uncharacterized protein YkwD